MRFSKEAHQQWFNSQPRKPMSAAVLFSNLEGEVLLVKPNYRDNWNLPGGVVDEHESPLSAAVREVKEELDLTIDPLSLQFRAVDYRPAKGELTDKLYFYFSGEILDASSISKIRLQESELDEMRFVTLDEAQRLTSKWTYRQIALSLSDTPGCFYLEMGAEIQNRSVQ